MTQEKANTIKTSLDNLYNINEAEVQVEVTQVDNDYQVSVTSRYAICLLVDMAKIVEKNDAKFFAMTDHMNNQPRICIFDF